MLHSIAYTEVSEPARMSTLANDRLFSRKALVSATPFWAVETSAYLDIPTISRYHHM